MFYQISILLHVKSFLISKLLERDSSHVSNEIWFADDNVGQAVKLDIKLGEGYNLLVLSIELPINVLCTTLWKGKFRFHFTICSRWFVTNTKIKFKTANGEVKSDDNLKREHVKKLPMVEF